MSVHTLPFLVFSVIWAIIRSVSADYEEGHFNNFQFRPDRISIDKNITQTISSDGTHGTLSARTAPNFLLTFRAFMSQPRASVCVCGCCWQELVVVSGSEKLTLKGKIGEHYRVF